MAAEDQAAAGARTRIEPLTRLATGGMAEIWLARELGAAGLERIVVVKRLLPHLARDQDIVDMFVSEARFIARLVHPNVVQIHELAEDDQGYFLVMEYVAGCTVRELALAAKRAGEVLPPEVGVCIIEQACRGAHAAHELTDSSGRPLGLVHRDISPHNLMINTGGDVKLLDFGIAKATEAAEATRTGSLKGKVGYMSPEQCHTKRVDRRSDVFALGIVLWELLVGKRLFQRDAEYASMAAIVSGEYELPTALRPDLPRAFDAVVAKALATDIEARWQSADDFRRALIEAADESGIKPTRDVLGAKVEELLGDPLQHREQALRSTGSSASARSALRQAMVRSEPSASSITGRSQTTSDDAATIVQHRSTPPATCAVEPAPLPLARPAEAQPPVGRGRWLALISVLVCAAAAIFWFLRPSTSSDETAVGNPSASADAGVTLVGPALRFVFAPSVQPDVMRRELAPFVAWFQVQLRRPVDIVVADSYQHSGELLATNRADIGLLPPLLFVQTFDQHPDVQPLALRLYDGSRGSDGYLLVRDDASLTGPEDLRGRKVCLVDRESTTGFLLPRIWMRSRDLDPDKDVSTVISGDHLAALRDLSEGRCDAAAVYSGAYLSAQKQGISIGTMRVLAITGRVPQDVIVASPATSAADAKRLREVLIAFDPQRDIDAPRLGAVLGISGFDSFDAEEFVLIRTAAEREGLIAGDSADAGSDAGP